MDTSYFFSINNTNYYEYSQLVSIVLVTLGFYFVFGRYGVKRIWCLIPYYRDYKLAECADREEEGKLYCIISAAGDLIAVFRTFFIDRFTDYPQVDVFLQLSMVVLSVILIFYAFRIYAGVCEDFGMKHFWAVLTILFEGIMLIFIGVSKKDHEIKKNQPIEENGREAAALSGYVAKETSEGLSVNIKARNAKNHFKNKTLLKDIHLNIEPGNMVLLLGGSGAGKTTFLNAITGYEPADAKILLDGDDVYKRFDKMKYNIGFVPQQDLIRYNDTVYRTLADAAALRLPSDLSRKEKKDRIEKVLDIFGLNSVRDNIVRKQSGGQKKRISIAIEFISDPSLFILDEPDSGLDGILARDLMNRLHGISREGKIVIVITHTPDRVIDLFDKVIVLGKDADRTGRLVFYGSIDEAKEFFQKDKMEDIVKMINREDEGGEGKADELIEKFSNDLNEECEKSGEDENEECEKSGNDVNEECEMPGEDENEEYEKSGEALNE